MLKTQGLMIVLSVMAIFCCITAVNDCFAGGGVNWKVTIDNPTVHKVVVSVYTRKNVATSFSVETELLKRVNIAPGASQTIACGAKCPVYFSGNIPLDSPCYLPSGTIITAYHLQYMSCTGQSFTNSSGANSKKGQTCCWNISAKICRKKGQADTLKDNDFGFCLK